MLTAEENERLTRVGPGTPMGNLLRRYWHPVAGVAEMDERWTLPVRILGEDLVLFKNRGGDVRAGRRGMPAPARFTALRDSDRGRDSLPVSRLEIRRHRPLPGTAERARRIRTSRTRSPSPATRCEEMGGLLWAYLGPLPAPLIPRYDGFVVEGTIRHCGRAVRQLQLDADHGELGRPVAHRVASRQAVRVSARRARRAARRSRSRGGT